MTLQTGDKVRVHEHGGEYIARITSTNKHKDPDGEQLYGLKVLEVITQPDNYTLNSGETCNAYPATVQPE